MYELNSSCSARIFAIAFCLAITFLATRTMAEAAPAFELPDMLGGKPVALSDFRGQVVYLDFWASWCGPCRKSFPAMQTLYQQFKNDGLVVIAVNLDDTAELGESFLLDHPVTYRTLYDAQKTLPETYNIDSMPTSLLIDRDGNIRYRHRGFKSQDLKHLQSKISTLLEE